jgi:L-ribulokinase
VILDRERPNLARQHPADYLRGIEVTVKGAIEQAKSDRDFSAKNIIGIGVDTTGSTPMPLSADGNALAFSAAFKDDPDAMVWLWKDHTAHAEAEEITAAAAKQRPAYLAKCGGRYSSEWFWAKILRCARVAPKVFEAAYTWAEIADWIPAVLAGTIKPDILKRGICAAGHKAFFNPQWGGYADEAFLSSLNSGLARVRRTLPAKAYTVAEEAGKLSPEWAAKLGLEPGITIAVGAFDAHLGAIGAGIGDGTLVKIMGTSTCDIMVSPMDRPLADVPGLCGIVPESVTPGCFGLEAGQSAVGDIFNWFVNVIRPGGDEATHAKLTAAAEALQPGESGLLTLDWHNGNRTILVDQRLTGLTLGITLQTTPAEIYRSLVESTAFGARVIMERFEEYGVPVKKVINCGGIAARSPLAMQIYADAMNRPLAISRSMQTCALGAAIAGAVAAGKSRGGHSNFADAVDAMTAVQEKIFKPIPANVAVYEKMYRLYRQIHDAFGLRGNHGDLSNVMKEMLDIRDGMRGA